MSKHTPGPWKFYVRDAGKPLVMELTGRRQLTGGDHDLLGVTLEKYGGDDAEAEANARLIAASPEMLAMLKLCLETIREARKNSYHGPSEGFLEELDNTGITLELKNLIAKAEGEE